MGEVVPIEGAPGHAHRLAFTMRVPRGVVCGITSFNSPLNFVAHKVAPALASGNTVVVKAPQATPFSAALFCEILLEAGLPPGHVNLVQGPGARSAAGWSRISAIRFYTFTGSTEVGKQLHRDGRAASDRARARQHRRHDRVRGRRSGSRGGARCANSAFRRAGQACTSTQRLFVHEGVLDRSSSVLAAADASAEGRRPARSGDRRRADDQRGRSGRAEQLGAARPSPGARLSSRRAADRRAAPADHPLDVTRRHARDVRGDLRARRLGHSVRLARRRDRRRSMRRRSDSPPASSRATSTRR